MTFMNLVQEDEKRQVLTDQTWPTDGAIVFSGVTLNYNDDTISSEDVIHALKNVSFDIRPREKV